LVRVEVRNKGKSKGQPNFSIQKYKVTKVIKGNGISTTDRYKLVDSNGNLMKNTYNLSSLLKINL